MHAPNWVASLADKAWYNAPNCHAPRRRVINLHAPQHHPTNFTPKKFYENDPWGQCYNAFSVRDL
jgi:hypothetical protein